MLKRYRADLHIHTCLSPCAELQITPSAILQTASERGLDIIAITDHNSAENIEPAMRAAEETDVTVLAGMEITSAEEAHILAFFDDLASAVRLQDIVYENLMPGENDEARFGEQVVVNEKDEVMRFNARMLIAATSLTARVLVDTIHALGGLSVASHIDREAFSIISQLGFIPEDLEFDAIEISRRMEWGKAMQAFSDYAFPSLVSFSDAHRLEDIGKRTTCFVMREPTIAEISSALRNIGGRTVERK